MKKEYLQIDKVVGPLIQISDVDDVFYGEVVDIVEISTGNIKKGKVIKIEEKNVIIQVFQNTAGLAAGNSIIKFTGEAFNLPMSLDLQGRIFNGIGQPIDNGSDIFSLVEANINGRPINPMSREYPRNFIQTGISSIDTLATLIRGQKLPIFSGNGLPHNELAAQIVRQARLGDNVNEEFGVVFAAIGVKHDDEKFFRKSFDEANVMDRVVMFVNYADDPIAERVTTPRCALTAAEYLAFEKHMHILVVMTDITSYCEALREISSAREEVPSRKGYPGYMYSDLASLYERAGMLKDQVGSITFLPILTMPNDDITHPIPDLTGYITEGQIVLGRDLFQRSIYPPVAILPSLSRLMKDGIGEGFTRGDHAEVANQLFASYSKVQEVRDLSQIIGEEDLSPTDKKYMAFGRAFEAQFLNQGFDEGRNIIESLDLGWQLLSLLPLTELDRLSPENIDKYFPKKA
ncbi:V-type ATP synthase subunit B [Acetobacterium wieringae]|jgi:V/A-type H+-transporting ATPase subunit B|uniref:V-type ATP synthase beta chain n=1 Tax=Acetobacterium wieringae TaxID=52694 RepID=A0A1F2PL40_9FIRM|nr:MULTISPECIES: V-type ATP synthase subunit B [Acetobacterium]MEA4806526.1 V-type ATP synthase subunit B [Acetobacterium wieringae]OFV72139.1 V-type sodium ATPase subunit B [Acetobacterium wieringae]OXS25728.1 MAG: V-type ATP synthase subunit B [Acetobacterium sp. MES1]TYC84638.1 V-type ATP synthase subunit B [Acetobacterium wieringae]UYO63901.1 V-type ATP synthase subunit B [Acetobacterium wieringae]